MRERYSDGYALAWVIIIMMILFLFLSSAMSLAAGSYARTQADHAKKQAALTARTLSQVLAEYFVNHSARKGGSAERILSQLEHGTEDVVSTKALQVEGLDSSLGICTVKAVYQKDTRIMTLTIKCILKGEEEIVSVDLQNEIGSDNDKEMSDKNGGEIRGDAHRDGNSSQFTYDWKIMGYQAGEDRRDELEKVTE